MTEFAAGGFIPVRQQHGDEVPVPLDSADYLVPPSGLRREPPTVNCKMPCDPDCEIGPVHCWNYHRPNHKPDWHDPATCEQGASA